MSEEKLFTLAEVAKHNTNKSARFVIHNKVYDVTAFLNEVSGRAEWSQFSSPLPRFEIRFQNHSLSRSFYGTLLAYHRRIFITHFHLHKYWVYFLCVCV